jgi:hypothetical protein
MWQLHNMGASGRRAERSTSEEVTDLACIAIMAPNSANVAAVDATTRERRCQFFVLLDAWRSMLLHHAVPSEASARFQGKGFGGLQAVHILSEAHCQYRVLW